MAFEIDQSASFYLVILLGIAYLIYFQWKFYFFNYMRKLAPNPKDPSDKCRGYRWTCSACSDSGISTWEKSYRVRWFINPGQPLPSRPKRATVYNAEKKLLFCTDCAGRYAALGSKTQHASLEAIDPTKSQNINLVAPLFDTIVIPMTFFFFLWKVGIPQEYVNGQDVCPLTHTARRHLYHMDSGLAYLLKNQFAWTCNLEDGYFRLFIDLWVRGISTDTDTVLLLGSQIMRALLFHHLFIKFAIVPCLALFNVAASSFVHYFGNVVAYVAGLPAQLLPPEVQNVLNKVNEALRSKMMYMVSYEKLPPPTTPRERPRLDMNDAWAYWMGRYTRMVEYYWEAGLARTRSIMILLPAFAIAIRALCLITNFDRFLRRMLFMPLEAAKTDAYKDVPIDAAGHLFDYLIHLVLDTWVPWKVATHVPFAFLVCYMILGWIWEYPRLRNWVDTRNWYGGQCGKAPLTEFKCKARWFPHVHEYDHLTGAKSPQPQYPGGK